MDETLALKATDFASVRKNISEEAAEGELHASMEYTGSRGPISCFYYVTFNQEARQRLPVCTAVKFREEENDWKVILYTADNRLTCTFGTKEMDAFCEAWNIQLAR